MHVPSYPRALALSLLVLASFAGSAQAVEFNERLKAPMMSEPGALRSQALSYVAKFSALQSAAPRELIRNRALASERFDLVWQIQQAIDSRRPLGDLSAVGLEAQPDGSYRVDYDASPQWDQLDQLLAGWLPQVNWQVFGEELVQRGFRPEDVAPLKEFVSTHDAQKISRRESLPISLGFSKIVKKYDKIKRPVDDAAVLSYIYQRDKFRAEKTRQWAESLLNSLEPQNARVLLAYFDEMSSTGVWAPSDQRAGIDGQLKLMRLADFEQLATAEAVGGTP
ncbi:MAG TPA: hypothetical protein VFS58_02060 [Steroidobacteraceae bacterium]|nr:hypothetical protein [Steroidobacteraceae bacterium]